MSALLNGSPLNGRALYVWAEGQSAAECESAAALLRAAYTASADHTAEAVTLTTAERTAWPDPVSVNSESVASFDGTRYAYLSGDAVGEAPSIATADRTAWMADAFVVGESVPVVTPARWRLLFATPFGEAAITLPDEDATVMRITRVRDTRGIALTAINEKAITRLHVNQVQFRSTCIGRARTSGLANTQIGFGISVAESVNTDDNLLVNVRRSMRGKSIAECVAMVDPHQIHVGNSIPAADAHMYIAPDILRADGSNERYAWAKPVAQTVFNEVDALAIRIATPDAPVGISSSIIADAFFTRDAKGSLAAASSSALDAGGARINRWRWGAGKSTAEAETSGVGKRLAWVGAFGASNGSAASTCAGIRYRWKWLVPVLSAAESLSIAATRVYRPASGDMTALAEGVAEASKIVETTALAIGESQSSIATVVYHWTWATGSSSGEAISAKANALRPVKAVPVKPMYAEAFTPRVYFRLNAGEPAPARRTIIVAARERLLAVPASSREYVIR